VVDTGATNHMTGAQGAFSVLDTSVYGTVKFGDGSMIRIEGCGAIIFCCKNGEHRYFIVIYYIPKLKINIPSISQLDELGYEILIRSRLMYIRDAENHLLAKIPHGVNQFYVLDTTIAQLVCLLVRGEDDAWRWHTCLGHLGVQALKKLYSQGASPQALAYIVSREGGAPV
jgi:hypothetical protein